MAEIQDFGHLIEGVVEQDPMTDRYVIRVPLEDGRVQVFDVREALSHYVGQEVRFTLATFDTINQIADFLERTKAQETPSNS